MGCDIHLWFEKKRDDGKWERLDIPEELLPNDRNYDVFAFLAGVRKSDSHEIEEQFAFRGLPKDTCCNFGEDTDLHSFTYAYIDEILRAPWKDCDLENSYFFVFCRHVLPRMLHACTWFGGEEARNIRIVMGFDS